MKYVNAITVYLLVIGISCVVIGIFFALIGEGLSGILLAVVGGGAVLMALIYRALRNGTN